MDIWLESASEISLPLFIAMVAGLLVAILLRSVSRGPSLRASSHNAVSDVDGSGPDAASKRPTAGSRWQRFFVEYVGNVTFDEEGAVQVAAPPDRRWNHATRQLVYHLRDAMERSRVPASETEEFLDALRQSIRSEEMLRSSGRGDPAAWRFLTSERWGLAQKLEDLVQDPPQEVVRRLKGDLVPGSNGRDDHAGGESG